MNVTSRKEIKNFGIRPSDVVLIMAHENRFWYSDGDLDLKFIYKIDTKGKLIFFVE